MIIPGLVGESEGAFQTVSGHCLKTASGQTVCCGIAYGLSVGGNPDCIGFTANCILLGEEPAGTGQRKRVQTHLQKCVCFSSLGFTAHRIS